VQIAEPPRRVLSGKVAPANHTAVNGQVLTQAVKPGLSPVTGGFPFPGTQADLKVRIIQNLTVLQSEAFALGKQHAAESRRPLGVVAVGGMISSTILTLLVIPVIYTLFAEWTQKGKKKKEA